jgi:transcriptional regulator with XRE-family HTH domain
MNDSNNLQRKQLIATVRKLRIGLGDTLQAFSERLGLAMASVVRYERNRAPSGRALVRLESVATASGFIEYAAVFRKAMDQEFAVPTPVQGKRSIQFKNDDEVELVQALLDTLRQDWRYAKEAKAVRKVLKPVLAQRRLDAEEADARDMQGKAIAGLLDSGRSVEDAIGIMRTDIETVADAFFSYGKAKTINERMGDIVAALLKAHWSIRQIAKRFANGDAGDVLRCAQVLEASSAIREYEEEEGAEEVSDDAQ